MIFLIWLQKFKGKNDIVLLISTAVLGFMTVLAAFCLYLVPSLSSGQLESSALLYLFFRHRRQHTVMSRVGFEGGVLFSLLVFLLLKVEML